MIKMIYKSYIWYQSMVTPLPGFSASFIFIKKKILQYMISIFQIFFRSLGLTFFIVLEAINHISICFNVLCDYMGH